jgi:hypothetical protein
MSLSEDGSTSIHASRGIDGGVVEGRDHGCTMNSHKKQGDYCK